MRIKYDVRNGVGLSIETIDRSDADHGLISGRTMLLAEVGGM